MRAANGAPVKWWRCYDELLDDPKVQHLPATLFKRYINLLCLANRGTPRGTLPDVQGIAFALRISAHAAEGTISALRQAGLLDDEEGRLVPHGWRRRQPESDDSAGRVDRYRHGPPAVTVTAHHADRNGASAVTVTAPEEKRGEEKRGEEKREEETFRHVRLAAGGFVIPDDVLALWREAYPAVDVDRAVRAAHAWAVANPANRKSNWARFLVAWLKREQDRAPRVASAPAPARPEVMRLPDLPAEQLAENRRRLAALTSDIARRRKLR